MNLLNLFYSLKKNGIDDFQKKHVFKNCFKQDAEHFLIYKKNIFIIFQRGVDIV